MTRCPEEDITDHIGFKLSKDRISALDEVDKAEFSWFHFRVCLIAGVGFFTDAYDIFSINIASVMMAFVYNSNNSKQSLAQTAIKTAAPIGTFIGQLLFGWLADRIGRKRMYGIELIIIIIGTFGQSLSANADIGTINIFAALIIWRIIMGLGIGGDYPLSAVIASEFAATHNRGKMMTAVFANQGWGQLASTIIAIIIVSIYHNRFPSPDQPLSLDTPCTSPLLITSTTSPTCLLRNNIDQAWRILIGLGCVPAVLALYFRLTIPETPRFTMDIERNVKQAIIDIEQFLTTGRYAYDPDSVVVRVVAPRGSWRDFGMYFRRWENWSVLVGCAYSWFAIDVIFYGLGLNTDKFFTALGFITHLRGLTTCPNGDAQISNLDNTANDVFRDFKNLIIANLLLSAVGLVPGYWATFLVIEKLGRKKIQMIGFGMLTVLFAIMGMFNNSLFTITPSAKIFLFLFILASFFQNFGPNTTTFLLPGENFPTRYRSTCHGICAACGKVGAIVSQFAFRDVSPKNVWVFHSTLLSFIAFTLTGGITTFYLVRETTQETLEEISGEESSSFIHGVLTVFENFVEKI
ncbi:major facilitator superfamily domain-containing protein [Irpex rosettiformis]|uniref:Major facilitator superfamily domain-containing protein n=1 Tax=Irpex rosettiformis TaxID=378272 RepID=A0ACB8UAP5_9APHY|nr:major facilitator superfamily domain-containing protein [Irpex rosettiformis]